MSNKEESTMQSSKKPTIVLLSVCFLLYAGNVSAQYQIRNGVFGNGGAISSGESYQTTGTVGQACVGTVEGASYAQKVGFWYHAGGLFTPVEKTPGIVPVEFRLDQNFPNPFNPTTTIRFAVPKPTSVKLVLYDILGREVSTLIDQKIPCGEHEVTFEADNLPSGVYVARLQAGEFTATRKLVLLR